MLWLINLKILQNFSPLLLHQSMPEWKTCEQNPELCSHSMRRTLCVFHQAIVWDFFYGETDGWLCKECEMCSWVSKRELMVWKNCLEMLCKNCPWFLVTFHQLNSLLMSCKFIAIHCRGLKLPLSQMTECLGLCYQEKSSDWGRTRQQRNSEKKVTDPLSLKAAGGSAEILRRERKGEARKTTSLTST